MSLQRQKIRVSKRFTFDMAHALFGHDGPCANIHGHTYHLTVTVSGLPISVPGHPKDGMVIDFSDLKNLIHQKVTSRFDHALVLNGVSPHGDLQSLKSQFGSVLFVEYQPSCENLVTFFAFEIRDALPEGCELLSLCLEETPTSKAEWHLSDNI